MPKSSRLYSIVPATIALMLVTVVAIALASTIAAQAYGDARRSAAS
jgi:hypothetical protein